MYKEVSAGSLKEDSAFDDFFGDEQVNKDKLFK
jgi:hypothetical protein